MLAQMHGCNIISFGATVVQIDVLFSELISRLNGLLALCSRKWAETIVSCPIPNAVTVHIHTLYITLPSLRPTWWPTPAYWNLARRRN